MKYAENNRILTPTVIPSDSADISGSFSALPEWKRWTFGAVRCDGNYSGSNFSSVVFFLLSAKHLWICQI